MTVLNIDTVRVWIFFVIGLTLLTVWTYAYDPATCIQCRKSHVCNPPSCFCCRDTMPLETNNIPQMVFFTFDDAVTPQVANYYRELFDNSRLNPNGCPIKMTLFISHSNTVYSLVREFYEKGMEIASHSVTHGHPNSLTFMKEAKAQKENLAKNAKIPESKITGWRSPFLEPLGDTQPSVLKKLGYEYDATLTITKKSPTDNSITPFTLDYGWPYDCKIKPCPAKSHNGFWEVPVVSVKDYLNKYDCVYVDGCNIPPPSENLAYKFLWDNFQRYYTTNRAPMGINMHASWFYYPDRKAAMDKFIKKLVTMDDVYIVTIKQVIDWLKEPTPLNVIKTFKPWQCNEKNETIGTAEFQSPFHQQPGQRVLQQQQLKSKRTETLQQEQGKRLQRQKQIQQQNTAFTNQPSTLPVRPVQPRPQSIPTITGGQQNINSPLPVAVPPLAPNFPLVRFWWRPPDPQMQLEMQRMQAIRLQRMYQGQQQAALQQNQRESERLTRIQQANSAKNEAQVKLLEQKRLQELNEKRLRQEVLKRQEEERLNQDRLIRQKQEEAKRQELLRQLQLEKQKLQEKIVRDRQRKELLKKQQEEKLRQEELLKQQQLEEQRIAENLRKEKLKLEQLKQQKQEQLRQEELVRQQLLEKQRLAELRKQELRRQQELEKQRLEKQMLEERLRQEQLETQKQEKLKQQALLKQRVLEKQKQEEIIRQKQLKQQQHEHQQQEEIKRQERMKQQQIEHEQSEEIKRQERLKQQKLEKQMLVEPERYYKLMTEKKFKQLNDTNQTQNGQQSFINNDPGIVAGQDMQLTSSNELAKKLDEILTYPQRERIEMLQKLSIYELELLQLEVQGRLSKIPKSTSQGDRTLKQLKLEVKQDMSSIAASMSQQETETFPTTVKQTLREAPELIDNRPTSRESIIEFITQVPNAAVTSGVYNIHPFASEMMQEDVMFNTYQGDVGHKQAVTLPEPVTTTTDSTISFTSTSLPAQTQPYAYLTIRENTASVSTYHVSNQQDVTPQSPLDTQNQYNDISTATNQNQQTLVTQETSNVIQQTIVTQLPRADQVSTTVSPEAITIASTDDIFGAAMPTKSIDENQGFAKTEPAEFVHQDKVPSKVKVFPLAKRRPTWHVDMFNIQSLDGPWQHGSINTLPNSMTGSTKPVETTTQTLGKTSPKIQPIPFNFFAFNNKGTAKPMLKNPAFIRPALFSSESDVSNTDIHVEEPVPITNEFSPVPIHYQYLRRSKLQPLAKWVPSTVGKTYKILPTSTQTSTTTTETTTLTAPQTTKTSPMIMTTTTTATTPTTTTAATTTTTMTTTKTPPPPPTTTPTLPTTAIIEMTSVIKDSDKLTKETPIFPRLTTQKRRDRTFLPIPIQWRLTGPMITDPNSAMNNRDYMGSTNSGLSCQQGQNCVLPNCFCKTESIPMGMEVTDVPQIVYITIDGSLNFHSLSKIRKLFAKRVNPNGCKVKGTMFITDTGSSYRISSLLHSDGIELAMMGMSSRPYSDVRRLKSDIKLQRQRISEGSDILQGTVTGWRSPGFQSLGDEHFRILSNESLYDSSLIVDRGASTKSKLWPFTLDFGWNEGCEIQSCPTTYHAGVWEVPVIPFIGPDNTSRCEYTDACTQQPASAEITFNYLMDNFNLYYKTNRAPFAIRLKQIWFHWYYRDNLKALFQFLDTILTYGDVYITSVSDMLEWMKKPTNLQNLKTFTPWKC